jgi:glycosyltransferase involved in cell wall biosynthesis
LEGGDILNRTVSVIVPCFNEHEVIASTHAELDRCLGASQDFSFEFIFVDDGSRDGTSAILREIRKRDPRVKLIRFSRNFGHQAAVSAGIDHAFGDAVAIMDADLQDPPEVLLSMLEKWREGFEVVYGVRRNRKEGIFKRACYRIFYRVWQRMADIEVPVDSGDFCVMDRQVTEVLRSLPENGRFLRGLRAWAGFRQCAHPYERAARHAGEPKYSFSRLVRLAASGIFNFSDVPLRFISLIGLLTSAGAIIGVFLVLFQRLFEIRIFGYAPQDMPGYTSLFLALQFFSGIQLLSLGIIGEYVARMYSEIKQRPVYVVAERLGVSPGQPQMRDEEFDRAQTASERPRVASN